MSENLDFGVHFCRCSVRPEVTNRFCWFLYSVILTEYVRMDLSCLSFFVSVSVCVRQLYSLNVSTDFDNISLNDSMTCTGVPFLRFWTRVNLMTSWRSFMIFRMWHFHSPIFSVSFKFDMFCLKLLSVCDWKSAKSVVKFWFYEEPRVPFFAFFSQNHRQDQNCRT